MNRKGYSEVMFYATIAVILIVVAYLLISGDYKKIMALFGAGGFG